jgi:hypothetical protein
MNEWLSGARNWWSTRSLHKKAEAGAPLLYRDDEDATLNGSWRHFLVSFGIHAVESFAAFALVLGVIFLLIWLFR